MEWKFEKKGFEFIVTAERFDNSVDVTIETKGVKTIYAKPSKHVKAGWGYNVQFSKEFCKLFGIKGDSMFIVHDSAKEVSDWVKMEEEKIKEEEENRKKQEEEDIKAGKIKITVSYRDGEYLSGYSPTSLVAADMLCKIGICQYVSGWGYYIKDEVIKVIGEEFTYEEALKYAEPMLKKSEEIKKEQQKKFEEAKRTGKPVLLYKYTTDCNDPDEECSLDIVYVYAMPDGATEEEREHTY